MFCALHSSRITAPRFSTLWVSAVRACNIRLQKDKLMNKNFSQQEGQFSRYVQQKFKRLHLAHAVIGAALLVTLYSMKKKWSFISVVEATTFSKTDSDDQLGGSQNKNESTCTKKTNASDSNGNSSYRSNKIRQYENRLREYSTVEKMFRYFATVELVIYTDDSKGDYNSYILMSPADLVRALSPHMEQPEGLGLDEYKQYTLENIQEAVASGLSESGITLPEDSIFYKLSSSGLISYSDYLFLLSVLSTSQRQFDLAFRVLDKDGDGSISYDEFQVMMGLIRQQSNIQSNQGGIPNKFTDSGLSTYFFGKKKTNKLTADKFLDFKKKLQIELLTIEFYGREILENGNISEADFCHLLLIHADISEKEMDKMLERVNNEYMASKSGISLNEYLEFFQFLSHMEAIELAFEIYYIAGASVSKDDFKHTAKSVAHLELSDHLVDVIFTVFDLNRDGHLSHSEFIAVMKNRLYRGLNQSPDIYALKVLKAMCRCGLKTISQTLLH